MARASFATARLCALVQLALALAALSLVPAAAAFDSHVEALSAAQQAAAHTHRRSLNFGVSHDARLHSAATPHNDGHATLLGTATTLLHAVPAHITEPYAVATHLAELALRPRDWRAAMAQQRQPHRSAFRVREDSYTDANSGLTYVYLKQVINGIEVADGDMNVVVDVHGRPLSYSSSFYTGELPDEAHLSQTSSSEAGVQQCLSRRSQVVFGAAGSASPCASAAPAAHLAADARHAALRFVAAASPNAALVSMLGNVLESPVALEEAAASISEQRAAAPRAHYSSHAVELRDVPGSTAPVTAYKVYTHDGLGGLRLAWRLNVPMDAPHASNFYEASVDVVTGEVLSANDWVKDMTISRPQQLTAPDFGPLEHPVDAMAADVQPQADKQTKPPLYRVLRWGINDPTEGNRTTEEGAHDSGASPYGWHTVPGRSSNKSYTNTNGNNVRASAFGASMDDWQHTKSAEGKVIDGALTFNHTFGWRAANHEHAVLDPAKYADASVTNLFYSLNEYHDLLHRYGFDAAAGNFEDAEDPAGGRGGDPIIAYAQSSAGINNADFTTPPDGQAPRVRMYKWRTVANATDRDGDFEQGVIVHEMTHGLSTRLTGGPSDSSCLGWGEGGMMGEGWGDILATIIRRKSPTRDIYPMGSWVSHNKAGIRKFPYSTNLTLSPETYESLNGMWEPHAGGEVWAAVLYQLEEGLRARHGWHPDLFPPPPHAGQAAKDEFWLTDEEIKKTLPLEAGGKRASKRRIPRHGNTLAVQLIIDAMKLQPCRPTFLSARDALLTADRALTGGNNTCLLWNRFADRGLGVSARVIGQTPWGGGIRHNDKSLPSSCEKSHL